MPATIFKSSNANSIEYGIENETGIILNNFSRNVQSVKTEVRDAENDVVAVAYSGLTATITLDGYINGTTTFEVAKALSLTNDTDGYGLNGGTIIVDSVNETTAQGDFKKVSISATQYPLTMS